MEIIDESLKAEDPNFKPWGIDLKTYTVLMHLAQFAGYFAVPFAGFILPIVMWASNKDQSPLIDEHGKNIINWMISSFLYLVAAGFLCIIFIGIFFLIGIAILSFVFTILGAVKAANGEVYKYPFTIEFIK